MLALLLIAVPTSASWSAPAPKPGAACKPAGAIKVVNGKKFTCVKSGRKFVWSKPVVIAKTPKPTPSPSAPATLAERLELKPIVEWSTSLNGTQLGDAAQLSYLNWVQAQQSAIVRHQFLVDGQPNANSLAVIQKGDKIASDLFSQFIPGGSVTLVSANGNWVVDKAASLGIPLLPEQKGGCLAQSWSFTYCINNNNFVGYGIQGSYDLDLRRPGMAGLPAHEYFHNVQSALMGSPGQVNNAHPGAPSGQLFPIWFVEGTADFVGYATVAQISEVKYSSFRDAMMSRPTQADPNLNALVDYTYRVGDGNGSVIYPYNVGRMAAEYLVASKGFDSILRVFQDFKDTKNFNQSFQNVYGMSVADFYMKFEAIRTKIGLPEVSMILVGEQNVPKS